MKVWSFWTGPKNWMVETCLKTIKSRCSDFTLLDLDAAEKLLGDRVHPVWRRLIPAHQADVVRACVMCDYGGLWVDADTVVLRDPFWYFENDQRFRYTTWSNLPRRILNGYVYSPGKKHPIAVDWFANVSTALFNLRDASDSELLALEKQNWTIFGEKCLTPAVDANRDLALQYPRSVMLPLDVDRDSPKFLSNLPWRDFIDSSTVAFGLSNSWLERRISQVVSGTLVHSLLEYAEDYLC